MNLIEEINKTRRELIVIGIIPIASNPDVWTEFTVVLEKLERLGVDVKFIAESDNQLFQHSLRTDATYVKSGDRISYATLKFWKGLVNQEVEESLGRTKKGGYAVSSLPISSYIIKIDDDIWYAPNLSGCENTDAFKKIDGGEALKPILLDYINNLIDTQKDGHYSSSPDIEMLEMFDQDQIPRGIYPRDCFYNTDHYQFVSWVFVFSRQGELLIHQRSSTAKDNRYMWDKSVGGHVDFSQERSSHLTAVRELIEELFTDEANNNTPQSLLSPSVNQPIFLGDWKPEGLGSKYLSHLCLLEKKCEKGKEPWGYYRIPGTIETSSPRLLPKNAGERKLRVMADAFVFISDPSLTVGELSKVDSMYKNSSYELVKPSELKSWIESGKNHRGDDFKVTPDLNYIMSGKFRDIIEEISQIIAYSKLKK